MSLPTATKSNGRPSSALLPIALLAVAVVAATTVAGPDTPCAEFMPGFQRCQFPHGFFDMMQSLCVGQIILLNGIPVFMSVLAAPSSRWKSGVHLLTIGFIGAVAGTIFALFGEWPTIGSRAPSHLIGMPFLTSVVVLAMLWLERLLQLTRRWIRPA